MNYKIKPKSCISSCRDHCICITCENNNDKNNKMPCFCETPENEVQDDNTQSCSYYNKDWVLALKYSAHNIAPE